MSCGRSSLIVIYQGSAERYLLQFWEVPGIELDLTGYEIKHTVRNGVEDADPVLWEKVSSGVDPEIEILDQVTYKGQARILFTADDTKDVDPGEYVGDLWIREGINEWEIVNPPGPFGVVIKRTSTKIL